MYFESLPACKVPIKGSPGDVYRQLQQFHQIPRQDFDPLFASFSEPEFMHKFHALSCERSAKALDVAQVVSVNEKTKTVRQLCKTREVPHVSVYY